MRKHFLLLFLMALLPLAGWAEDYDVMVMPTDASASWCGDKPTVQSGWIMISSNSGPGNPSKADIAAQLEIKSLDNTNVGDHTYALQKKAGADGYVEVGGDKYYIQTSGSNTATLTIEKFEGAPVFTTTDLAFVDGDLVYTSEAQALLSGGATATANGFAVPVVYATSATAENWVALADLKETNANTTGYNVYYKVVGTNNYAGSEVQNMAGTKAIAKATITFNVEAKTGLVYDGTDQALLQLTDNTKSAVNFGTLQYKITGDEYTTVTDLAAITGKSAQNGTAYSVKLKVPASADGNWDEAETSIDATIAKATPIFTHVPTFENGGLATGLVYNPQQTHKLVLKEATAIVENTEISVPVKYSMRRYMNVSKGYTSWTDKTYDQLVGTYASSQYQIRVKTDETDDLNQAIQLLEKVAIAKATIPADAYTEPVEKNVRTTGALQPLVVPAAWKDAETTYGTFQYSLTNNGTDWSTEIPQGTDVSEYTVYWRIYPTVTSGTQNYDIVSGNYTSNITNKSKVTVTIPANQSFGYGTTPTLEYTATWEVQGSDVLKEEGLTWTWYTGATGDTQASKVGGYYPAGEYYVMVSGLAVDGTTAASQEIVYPTDRQKVKITAGQIVATIGGTATYGVQPEFTLTHVSGLSDAEAATLNTNNTVKTVTIKNKETGAIVTYKDGDENKELKDVVLDSEAEGYNAAAKAALAKLNAGPYTLEATAEYTPNTNYTLLVNAGSLVVDPYTDATGITIEEIAAVDYKAAKWEPEVTVKRGTGETAITLTADTDYTVAYGDNTHNNKDAGEGIVKITGIGNYKDLAKTANFTIKKVDVKITADDFTGDDAWTYGTTENTYTVTVTHKVGEQYLPGLAGEETLAVGGTLDGINGKLKVKRTSSNTVGMHTGALVAGFYNDNDVKIEEPAATNYNLEFVAGNLQVAKGAVVIKLKDAVTGTYGDTGDALATTINTAIRNIENYEYVSGLSELEAANFASIIDVTGANYTLADAKYVVDTNYPFAIADVTSTNYKVKVEDSAIEGEIKGGIYKVNPSPITLKAKNQTVDYATATPNTTVSEATSEEDENGTVLVITSDSQPGLQYDDEVKDLIESIIIKTVEDVNVITLKAKGNKNYNITPQTGILTVVSEATTLEMTSVYDAETNDNWFSTIQSYDGKDVVVKITVDRTQTLKSGKTYTWKGEDWNAFILPFDITPKELSEAFGYAIVNVVDPAKTEGNNIGFKLQMSGIIPANTPFMLKNYQAVAAPNNVITFGDATHLIKIKAPESAEVSVDANTTGDIKFIGSYNKKTIDKTNSNLYYYNGEGAWKHLTSSSTNTWNIAPFNAYIETPATVGAQEFTFTFEDLNGNTTAIKSISEDATSTNAKGWYDLKGMKMENAPTQKGVYIKDGKKVVIK